VIVDTSAVVAVTLCEQGFEDMISALERAPFSGIGTPTLVETAMVLSARLGGNRRDVVSQLLHKFAIVPVPFGDDHWRRPSWLSNASGEETTPPSRTSAAA
jgi:ribonuclease VapC